MNAASPHDMKHCAGPAGRGVVATFRETFLMHEVRQPATGHVRQLAALAAAHHIKVGAPTCPALAHMSVTPPSAVNSAVAILLSTLLGAGLQPTVLSESLVAQQ